MGTSWHTGVMTPGPLAWGLRGKPWLAGVVAWKAMAWGVLYTVENRGVESRRFLGPQWVDTFWEQTT